MSTQTELWLDRRFDDLYFKYSDPWGCGENVGSISNELFLRMICAYKPVHGRALDIGCGLGVQSFKLSMCSGGEVTGIDISSVAIEKAKARFPEINFHVRDIMNDDITDLGVFGLITMSEVLWYICEKLDTVLRKIGNALSPGGILAIHQYFPTEQKHYKDVIDGWEDFKTRMSIDWDLKGLVVSHCCQDGPVMLALYQRR